MGDTLREPLAYRTAGAHRAGFDCGAGLPEHSARALPATWLYSLSLGCRSLCHNAKLLAWANGGDFGGNHGDGLSVRSSRRGRLSQLGGPRQAFQRHPQPARSPSTMTAR